MRVSRCRHRARANRSTARHFVARATPAEVYAVVTDFPAYPRLFPEIKQTRVLSTTRQRRRASSSAPRW